MDKNAPIFDTSLSVSERAKWLLSVLTVEEKLGFFASHPEVERIGLSAYRFGGEGAHGLQARGDQREAYKGIQSTSLSQPIGMVASWDKDLIRKAGNVTGTECRAFYNFLGKKAGASRFAPTVDLCRDPRWGRNEEGYGEDPYLTGKMGGNYLYGMQDEHNYDGSPVKPGERGDRIRIASNLKHFYANNVEWRRCYDSFDITDKVKYDYELEPYRYCIEEFHAEGVMTCYNEINHVPGMINPEVQEILKDKWGLKHAVTDGGDFLQTVNFHHTFKTHGETLAAGIKAGVDDMLDNPAKVHEAAIEAWENGLITEEDIDKSIQCMLETRIRLGDFDEYDPYDSLSLSDIGTKESSEIALQMAKESNILLKNEDKFLPLSKDDDIVLVGPQSDTWYPDWYGGLPMYKETVKSGIEKETGKPVRMETGLNKIKLKVGDRYVGISDDEKLNLILVDDENKAEIFLHTSWGSGSNFFYSEKYKKYVNFNMDGEVRLEYEQPYRWFITESLTCIPSEGARKLPEAHNANNIEFDTYWEGEEGDIKIYGFGARAISEKDGIIMGNDMETIKQIEGSYEGKNIAEDYGDKAMKPVVFTVEIVENGIEKAKALAKEGKKVIFAIGCNPVVNAKEEIDRKSLQMIPYQENLLKEVVSVNPNVVVVLMTNYPYLVNWMQENVKAILTNSTGSQDMGTGLASALFGTAAPAGRTPMTWYLSDSDLPDMTDYDLIKNPRTYRYFTKEVMYPFGFGLTYTDFKYEKIDAKKCDSGKVDITLSVSNVGDTTSDEVIEVYMKRVSESKTVHPVRRLISFERLHDILPGESREITLTVNPSDLAIYMEDVKERIVEPGTYLIYAGKNALDEAVSVEITL